MKEKNAESLEITYTEPSKDYSKTRVYMDTPIVVVHLPQSVHSTFTDSYI